MKVCFHCHREVKVSNRVSFRDTCSFCNSDLHACLNCRFYDRHSYNECREPQSEWVGDKDRANTCDFFAFADFRDRNHKADEAAEAKAKLNEIFKKLG
jgi:hypothetical protein